MIINIRMKYENDLVKTKFLQSKKFKKLISKKFDLRPNFYENEKCFNTELKDKIISEKIIDEICTDLHLTYAYIYTGTEDIYYRTNGKGKNKDIYYYYKNQEKLLPTEPRKFEDLKDKYDRDILCVISSKLIEK